MARGTWGGTTDPNIFKVNFRFRMGSSHCQTGFKLRDVGVQDNTAQEVADEVATQLGTGFRALLSVQDVLEGIDVLKLGTEEGGWHPYEPAAGVGSIPFDAAKMLPQFLAANVSLKSEIRKRYGQGRMFLPLRRDEYVDGDLLTAGAQDELDQFLDPLSDHFTGDPLTHDLILVNAHPLMPPRGSVGGEGYRPEIPASWYDVVSLRTNSAPTFLRSRKVGVGT